MKTLSKTSGKRGFTLMELMVAMAITTIIVTVLVSVTSIALDTWNRSRSELRASRQAKSMLESMAKDFEALVVRKGNNSEWLSAKVPTTLPGDNMKSSNAAELFFFTAVTDRYDGKIGSNDDKGGDISCASYRLDYRDPMDDSPTGKYKTFVVNRHLVNPDDSFKDLMGDKTDMKNAIGGSGNGNTTLEDAFAGKYQTELNKPESFMCENIFQFSMTFHLEVTKVTGSGTTAVTTISALPVTLPNQNGTNFDGISLTGGGTILMNGDSIVSGTVGGFSKDEILSSRLTAVEISVSVLSDFAVDQIRNRTFSGNQEKEFLAKNTYQYSKLIQVPSM